MYICMYVCIGLVGRVFANGPVDLGSIPGRVIPKTVKMVLDTSLLNTQQYKVRMKGKVEQSRERSCALLYTAVQQSSKREPLGRRLLRSPTLLFIYIYINKYLLRAHARACVCVHICKHADTPSCCFSLSLPLWVEFV